MEIDISAKFKPLFNLLDDSFYPEIDTVIITGGRYSLKSYTVSIFSLIALVNYQWNVLYTRFTNMSIIDSIKPEVTDKIDLLDYSKYIQDTKTQIECKENRISFKGIKTGSQQQTANLKSLSGFNLFVNDEAEELPDYKTFKKIFYSIRSTKKRNLTILILNPTTRQHWIFEEFFEKKGLEGGNNCIVDNVMYIHSSYLDCDFGKMPNNILADYERLKIENEIEYNNIVLGGWITEPEGLLIPLSKVSFTDYIATESIIFRFAIIDPADKGGDKMAAVFCSVIANGNKVNVFIEDALCNKDGIEINNEVIIDKIRKHKSEVVLCESNGVGLAAVILLKKTIEKLQLNVKLSGFPTTDNKEIRILSNYEFVRDNFIFNNICKDENNYRTFVSDLTTYIKEAENKHRKDAIDVACMAANVVKIKYRNIIWG